jgi:hypothetical protein
LSPSGYAGFRVMTSHLLGGVQLHILDQERSGPYEAEVAFEHVPQLGEFVQTCLAEEPTEPGQASSVWQGPPFVVRDGGHGSEFHEREHATVQAGPWLSKEDRTAHDQKCERGHGQEQRRQQNEPEERNQDVHESLKRQLHDRGPGPSFVYRTESVASCQGARSA